MANREVNLTKRVKTLDGLRFCAVVFYANGRVKPDVVLVDGKPEHHTEGAYYIEWYEGPRRRRLSVGRDAAEAHARRLAKEAELNAINQGVAIAPQNGNARVSLAAAIQDFLEEKRLQRKGKTHADYDTALRYFQQSCPKQYLQDVTRKDLLSFALYCREELELSQRTVFNKFARIVALLKAHKIKFMRRAMRLVLSKRSQSSTSERTWMPSSRLVTLTNGCGLSSS